MEPTQQQPQTPAQQPQQSAVAYYNKNRKRSFLFSRITVITSMFVLVIALAVNIFALSSQDKSTIKSNASTPENPAKILPTLTAGCMYKEIKGGLIVTCPTAAPTIDQSVPINITLPVLPPQCGFETSASGSAVRCITPHAPIPTVPVTLPPTCSTTTQLNSVACKNNNNQTITVPLPSLPQGCTYSLVTDKYYVVCQPK